MTVGAGGGLVVLLKSLLDPGDEVVLLAPFFAEYTHYVANFGAKSVVVQTDQAFRPDAAGDRRRDHAADPGRARQLAEQPQRRRLSRRGLRRAGGGPGRGLREAGSADRPDLGRTLPRDRLRRGRGAVAGEPLPAHRPRHVVLEGPGAARRAHRLRGAQSRVGGRRAAVARHGVLHARPGIRERAGPPAAARRRRCSTCASTCPATSTSARRLLDALDACGYEVVRPQGAFYLFPRVPGDGDDVAFVQTCVDERLLVVPGSGFARPGHVRMAYAVTDRDVDLAVEALARIASR